MDKYDKVDYAHVDIKTNLMAYEKRFLMFHMFLMACGPEVKQVCITDVNDVALIGNPWINELLIGEEHIPFGLNRWFLEALHKYLPENYRLFLAFEKAEYLPLNTGFFSGPKDLILKILKEMIDEVYYLHNYIQKNPTPISVMLDMHAFNFVLFDKYTYKICKMDGKNGSPVIHDRKAALRVVLGENI